MLAVLSIAAAALASATLLAAGMRWQLVPWQVLGLAVAVAAALRRWRPRHSRRWRRVVGRGALVVGLAVGGLALLTAVVPTLPKPSGPHRVGSVIFRWTDTSRPETFTADPSDHREVIAQAWYPSDATTGRAVPYFEAQGHLPSIEGLPSFMFASFGRVATHATVATRVSAARRTWPVLFFSPGLSIPREAYTALSADLASRGYVVVALSVPYESSVSVLADGQVIGQTIHPDVMGPPPHRALERLIATRVADIRFALDRLDELARLEPAFAARWPPRPAACRDRRPLDRRRDRRPDDGQRPALQGRRQPRRQALRNRAGRAPEPPLPLDRLRHDADQGVHARTGPLPLAPGRPRRTAHDPREPAPQLHRRSVVPDVAWARPGRYDPRHGFALARRHDVDDWERDRRLRRPGARRRARTYPRGGPCRLPRDPLAVADGNGR